jgi:hypothetical protein
MMATLKVLLDCHFWSSPGVKRVSSPSLGTSSTFSPRFPLFLCQSSDQTSWIFIIRPYSNSNLLRLFLCSHQLSTNPQKNKHQKFSIATVWRPTDRIHIHIKLDLIVIQILWWLTTSNFATNFQAVLPTQRTAQAKTYLRRMNWFLIVKFRCLFCHSSFLRRHSQIYGVFYRLIKSFSRLLFAFSLKQERLGDIRKVLIKKLFRWWSMVFFGGWDASRWPSRWNWKSAILDEGLIQLLLDLMKILWGLQRSWGNEAKCVLKSAEF